LSGSKVFSQEKRFPVANVLEHSLPRTVGIPARQSLENPPVLRECGL
jgi:hypothetical protein